MFVDVSEVKTFRECKRKWQLTSRNKFHLTSLEPKAHFSLGTLFHEGLHALYAGVSIDEVMEDIKPRMESEHTCLLAMLPGYAKSVIDQDLERFKIIDLEHSFKFKPEDVGYQCDEDLFIRGSIDMIAVEKDTNKVFGFEHKTAKNFRDACYLWMDEQPRLYTIALQQYVDVLNKRDKPEIPYTLGGIYINEVKKLLRDFKYSRSLCTYPSDDLDNFFKMFLMSASACKQYADLNIFATPTPGWMTCQLCDFKSVCETYMYGNITKEQVLKDFSDVYIERENDHLEEK